MLHGGVSFNFFQFDKHLFEHIRLDGQRRWNDDASVIGISQRWWGNNYSWLQVFMSYILLMPPLNTLICPDIWYSIYQDLCSNLLLVFACPLVGHIVIFLAMLFIFVIEVVNVWLLLLFVWNRILTLAIVSWTLRIPPQVLYDIVSLGKTLNTTCLRIHN